jgi:lipopolysaccharide transport system ATP-binding protein
LSTIAEEDFIAASTPELPGEVLVRVENVSKKFCRSLKKSMWYGLQDAAAELTGQKSDYTLRQDEFWAVKDVSFELRRGECLGLIGRNGAGKTTLLRILNGLIKPDQGRIEMRGRVGAMIALGAGFNPLLTGRENVYVNGSILGLNQAEIDEKYEEIVDFAELHDFMEAPVSSYSSGMYVRLGFAVASTIKPDILIIDEVLAVGDSDFKLKSSKRMHSVLDSGCAVILVSHNMTDVRNLASKVMWLDKGKVKKIDKPQQVIGDYLGTGHYEISEINWNAIEDAPGSNAVKLRRIGVLPKNGKTAISISTGGTCVIEFDCFEEGLKLDCTLEVINDEGVIVFHTGCLIYEKGLSKIGHYEVNVVLPSFLLNSGSYYLTLIIGEKQSIPLVKVDSVLRFKVENEAKGMNYNQFPGVVHPNLEWSVLMESFEIQTNIKLIN